ncbi:MAG: hypothetical protein IJ995_01280 [Clostridia bacterium]|nr:hypothetical protein [Clostridia bacterium]
MSEKKKITKNYTAIKTIFQILLYLFEIIFIVGLCTYISFIIHPTSNSEQFISILERFALFYGFYQIVVFVVFNNINDIQADEYLALHTACEHALLACKYNDEKSKDLLIKTIENKQLSSATFNDVSVRMCYVDLITCIKENNIPAMESLKITSNHNYEMSNLQWRFSILLRFFK